MTLYLIQLQGQREPIHVELDCPNVDHLAELAAQSRFLIGNLVSVDEQGCNPRVMIAAGRISCAIEVS
ncbi:hypothetical protein ACLBKT_02125 [Erythrobacter sp. W302b]|uniref:hypothetical protein n=1 Tax=Erythrobacter sp. W302b TaxID=3389874 RepID=UPI00396B2BD9